MTLPLTIEEIDALFQCCDDIRGPVGVMFRRGLAELKSQRASVAAPNALLLEWAYLIGGAASWQDDNSRANCFKEIGERLVRLIDDQKAEYAALREISEEGWSQRDSQMKLATEAIGRYRTAESSLETARGALEQAVKAGIEECAKYHEALADNSLDHPRGPFKADAETHQCYALDFREYLKPRAPQIVAALAALPSPPITKIKGEG